MGPTGSVGPPCMIVSVCKILGVTWVWVNYYPFEIHRHLDIGLCSTAAVSQSMCLLGESELLEFLGIILGKEYCDLFFVARLYHSKPDGDNKL